MAAGTLAALLNIVQSNYMSEHIPAQVIPRVASTSQLLTNCATLLGALAAGALTELVSVRLVVGLFAALQLVAIRLIIVRFGSAGIARSSRVRRREAHSPYWALQL